MPPLPTDVLRHTRAELYSFLKDLVLSPDLQPGEGVTYCNIALQRTGKFYNYPYFDGLVADEIATKAIADQFPVLEKITGDVATDYAMKGGFCFAAHVYPDHGHVAVISPQPMAFSPSWNKRVPVVANVGFDNAFLPASQAFPVSLGEPSYYKILGTETVSKPNLFSFLSSIFPSLKKSA